MVFSQGPQAFATFPTLPCLQVLWKEISNNTVSEEEKIKRKKQKEKPTYKRPSREAVGFTHHQSKTPTLASEQRNAHPPQSPMSAVSPKMARLSASVASGLGKPLATLWSQKKGHHHHQPTAAPPETGEVKKTNLKLPEFPLWKKV